METPVNEHGKKWLGISDGKAGIGCHWNQILKDSKVEGIRSTPYFFFLKNSLLFWERESGRAEGEKESQADSPLSSEPEVGLNLPTLRSWPVLKTRVGYLTN